MYKRSFSFVDFSHGLKQNVLQNSEMYCLLGCIHECTFETRSRKRKWSVIIVKSFLDSLSAPFKQLL